MTEEFVIPSSPSDRKKIQDALLQMRNSLQKIKDEQSYIKDTADLLKNDHKMPPKLARALAKSMLEHNFSDVQTAYENFETAYEVLVEGRKDA